MDQLSRLVATHQGLVGQLTEWEMCARSNGTEDRAMQMCKKIEAIERAIKRRVDKGESPPSRFVYWFLGG